MDKGWKIEANIELVVEGMPVITSLAENSKEQELTCEAEGVPEPQFKWSIKVIIISTSYTKGKAIQKVNITETDIPVACNVSNKFGGDVRSINVTSTNSKMDELNGSLDHATIVMVVIILLVVVVAALGVGYWLYKKNR
ncbi:hypothetical protein OJAV_G00140590 [Oryzias javanicus]|uniref:Ig-like domain-containing protein n=1 Tax=Oryzias javanicus TaxID=123683 RepID=A0A437CM44_ORYJA|nr:hypothetical protein OJAV_G00140590 [Oryzias javanicus]